MVERHFYCRGFTCIAFPCVVVSVTHAGHEVVRAIRGVVFECQHTGICTSSCLTRIVADDVFVKLAFTVGIACKAELLVGLPKVGVDRRPVSLTNLVHLHVGEGIVPVAFAHFLVLCEYPELLEGGLCDITCTGVLAYEGRKLDGLVGVVGHVHHFLIAATGEHCYSGSQ